MLPCSSRCQDVFVSQDGRSFSYVMWCCCKPYRQWQHSFHESCAAIGWKAYYSFTSDTVQPWDWKRSPHLSWKKKFHNKGSVLPRFEGNGDSSQKNLDSDAIWCHGTCSILVHVMACCLFLLTIIIVYIPFEPASVWWWHDCEVRSETVGSCPANDKVVLSASHSWCILVSNSRMQMVWVTDNIQQIYYPRYGSIIMKVQLKITPVNDISYHEYDSAAIQLAFHTGVIPQCQTPFQIRWQWYESFLVNRSVALAKVFRCNAQM